MQDSSVLDWILELIWEHLKRLITSLAWFEVSGTSVTVPKCHPAVKSTTTVRSFLRGAISRLLFDLTDEERDARSGDEWLLSVHSYLEWRAGKSWRKIHRSGERWNDLRWHYLGGIRLLNELRYKPESGPALVLPQLNKIEKRHRHLPSLVQVQSIAGVR